MREGDVNTERVARTIGAVDPRWDAVRTEHALAGMHRRKRRRRALLGAGVMTTALAVALILAQSAPVPRQREAHTSVAIAKRSAVSAAPRPPLRFADGSVVMPDALAEVVLATVSNERIALRLDAGSISVEVTPRTEREFEVICGRVRVVVLGTGFVVERRAERTYVRVLHGRVRVVWDRGARELGADEDGTFPLDDGLTAAASDIDAPREAPPRPRPSAASAPSAAATDWRPLAERGEYDAAYLALTARGERAVDDEVETLLLAADVARLSGHGVAALPYLERAASHHDDPRALLASFTRGRILVSLARAAEGAAEFERVAERAPTGALAEDALARAIEAHQRAGHADRSRELARRYLHEHPRGRWIERAEAALGAGSGAPAR